MPGVGDPFHFLVLSSYTLGLRFSEKILRQNCSNIQYGPTSSKPVKACNGISGASPVDRTIVSIDTLSAERSLLIGLSGDTDAQV